MKITSREIVEILKTARELGYREFRLEHDGLRLSASSNARAHEANATFAGISAPAAPAQHLPRTQPHADATPARHPQTAPSSHESRPTTPATSCEGLMAITAPMSGTFYRSPSPGAPPFVEVGSEVNANDIVCIIEIMKLFNSIRASTAGTIAEIAADNDASVVAGQPIIWIKPA